MKLFHYKISYGYRDVKTMITRYLKPVVNLCGRGALFLDREVTIPVYGYDRASLLSRAEHIGFLFFNLVFLNFCLISYFTMVLSPPVKYFECEVIPYSYDRGTTWNSSSLTVLLFCSESHCVLQIDERQRLCNTPHSAFKN